MIAATMVARIPAMVCDASIPRIIAMNRNRSSMAYKRAQMSYLAMRQSVAMHVRMAVVVPVVPGMIMPISVVIIGIKIVPAVDHDTIRRTIIVVSGATADRDKREQARRNEKFSE